MTIPKGFRVSVPRTIGRLLGEWGHDADLPEGVLDGQWITVSGGPLPTEVDVRIDRADDGRFMITGILIGRHGRREVTWETLRDIKPASVLAYLFSGFDPLNPAQLVQDSGALGSLELTDGASFDAEAFFEGDDSDEHVTTTDEMNEQARALATLELWRALSSPVSTPHRAEPVTKPRASVATDLTAFAEVYRRHLSISPSRATAATAKELHCSRATVLRRVTECRRLGLISTPEPKDNP